MLLDYVAEVMALDATLASDPGLGLLLALLIALQNYPEGFNACAELHEGVDIARRPGARRARGGGPARAAPRSIGPRLPRRRSGAFGRGHARRRRRHPPSDLPGHRTPSAPRARLERLLRAVFGVLVDMVGEQVIG